MKPRLSVIHGLMVMAVSLSAGVLVSCAPAADISTRFLAGVPEGVPEVVSFESRAYLTADESSVVVLSFGSSSCTPTPTAIEATGDAEVTVTWASSWAFACTGDLAARAWWLELPESFSPALPFTLVSGDTSHAVQRSDIEP